MRFSGAASGYQRDVAKTLDALAARPAAWWHAKNAGDDYGERTTPSWRDVDWREHAHRMEIDGAGVNYVDIGSGDDPPYEFEHGLSGQWQNWLENIPPFAQERRVIALDLPGHGCSDMPRERITIERYGRGVEALCDRLGIGEAVLVGNSMGGFVSSEVAIQFPERVHRLALVAAAGISSANVRRAPVLTLGRALRATMTYSAVGHRRIASRPRARHVGLAFVARHPTRIPADLAYEGLMKGAGKPGFHDALRACIEYDFRDRLPEIRCPTLIVWGENDAILPAKDSKEFERLIPDTRTLMLEDTGHVPMLERPGTFNGALREFIGAGEDESQGETDAAAAELAVSR